MKKFLIFFLLLPIVGNSQQDPYFVSEGFGALWNNPASFGAKYKLAANTVGRLHWLGIDGAPRSFMANAEANFDFQVSQQALIRGKLGGGIVFVAERIGGRDEIIFQVPINYHIPIKETYLSLGIAPGFRNTNLSNGLPSPPINPNTPVNGAGTIFKLDAGAYWYSNRFHLGLSSTQVTRPHKGNQGVRHYYLHGGYRFKIGEHYLFPQVQFLANSSGLGFYNLNYFQFKNDIFSVGLGVSAGRDILFAATYRYKSFKIAYNFDLNTGPLSSYTVGSHEFRLSYQLPNK